MSPGVRKLTICILTKSDTNQAVQSLEMARGLKFCIYEVEVASYPSSENKGADQLRGLYGMVKDVFGHDEAFIKTALCALLYINLATLQENLSAGFPTT